MRSVPPVRLAACLLLVAGCREPAIDFLEVQRVDEPLAISDLERLERIAAHQPGKRLPSLSPHFLPPPRWDAARPATIATLGREELERLRESTRLSTLTQSNGRNPRLRYALKEEGLTLEQYTSLLLAVGLAVQRGKVDPARDLARYVSDGQRELRRLAEREESFARLTDDQRIRAIDDATWITRVDRARRLQEVPAANVDLVTEHASRLAAILPAAFQNDPLAEVADPIRDYGVPFRERADSGFDSELTWTRNDEGAIVGTAPLFEEARQPEDAGQTGMSR